MRDKNILIGMTGGIACYKVVGLLSLLKKQGINTKVILTKSALEFITPLTIKTMSGGAIYDDAFSYDIREPLHIELAKWADVFLIAPASANTIAKLRMGIADNLLLDTALACTKELLISPAMNVNMYNNPATKENLNVLRERGHLIIEPSSGLLACGDEGVGKLPEPQTLFDYLEYYLTPKDLKGKRIVVTAGAAIEDIDPVRFITNRSSGKMGYSIAKRAAYRGAEVIMLKGNNVDTPLGVKAIEFRSTDDLLNIMLENFDWADIVIQAAAPADYTLDKKEEKLKKEENDLSLNLHPTPDVAEHIGKMKGKKRLVAFAAETHNLKENALKKIAKKNVDFIVANDVSKGDRGFQSDNNTVSFYFPDGREVNLMSMSKLDVADRILDEICIY